MYQSLFRFLNEILICRNGGLDELVYFRFEVRILFARIMEYFVLIV